MDAFVQAPTLSVIGDVMVIEHPQNRPFEQYPRNVAKRAVEYMKELGIADEMIIGPEYEFHVFRPHDGYHADQPGDRTFDLRNAICQELARWGVDVKYHHHEVGGSGQLEVEVELGEMTRLADATMAAKYVIRNTAAAHGMTATLMPKLIMGEAGNGMHVHMLLKKDGNPVFYDENNYAQLSQTGWTNSTGAWR